MSGEQTFSVDLGRVVERLQRTVGELSGENATLKEALIAQQEENNLLREQLKRADSTDFARRQLEQQEASNAGSLPEGAVAPAGEPG